MAEAGNSTTNTVPTIYLSGSHYDIGHKVGETFKDEIHLALERHTTLKSRLIPFYETVRGEEAYNQLLASSQDKLPQYMDEIRGISDGAQAPFYQIFLFHIEADLIALMEEGKLKSDSSTSRQAGEGCSDFFINNKEWSLHVHSEDADPGTADLCVVWIADIEGSETNGYKAESFISFAYPGMIPGNAWTVNSHGLMISGNILFQKQVFTSGMIPRRLQGRALMNEKSIDGFLNTLKTLPASASGFNFMLSQREGDGNKPGCIHMTSVEIVGRNTGNLIENQPASEFQHHFNEYQWMSEPSYPDPSSRVREKRLEEMKQDEFGGVPTTLNHIKYIMSDTKYTDFPFYRDGAAPDYLATATIAIGDRYKDEMYIYNKKPDENDPALTIDIQPWHGTGTLASTRLIH